MSNASVASLLVLVLVLACTDAAERHRGLVVQDSAGIQIIYSASPAWSTTEEWEVAAKPVLELGVTAGAPELEFQTILGLTRLENGNVVVGNKGTSEIRLFGPTGEYIRAFGRQGEGPGEFRALGGVYAYRGDSLVVWDYRLIRWSVYDTAGEFGRVIRPDVAGWNLRSLSPMDDGSLLVVDNYSERPAKRMSLEYARVFHVAPGGELIDSLGAYQAGERFRPLTGERIVVGRIFGARLLLVGAAKGYLIGRGEEYEILEFGPDGRLRRRVRWTGPDRSVTSADVELYRERFIARQKQYEDGERFARFVLEVPAADRFPAYSAMIRDRAGNVWLGAFSRPGSEERPTWTVLESSGRWLGEVVLPHGLEVWEIGVDYVLGVFEDDLGVERVRMYPLQKQH